MAREVTGSEKTTVQWQSRPLEPLSPVSGKHVSVSRFSPESDAQEFVDRLCAPKLADLWRYIPFDPFESAAQVSDLFGYLAESDGWIPYMFRHPSDGRVIGTATHMRVRPDAGSAEVGFVVYSPEMQRTPAATEAMYLLARHVFDASGYRRYEWKCDNENAASKRAAERLGFVFEGVFRQDMIVKGRNRDTAWFSMLDREWPACRTAFRRWLAPENFDSELRQLDSLADFRES